MGDGGRFGDDLKVQAMRLFAIQARFNRFVARLVYR